MKRARRGFGLRLAGVTVLGLTIAAIAHGDALDRARVVVQTLTTTEEADILLFPARVQSAVQTKIFAETEGLVSLVPVHVGQRISKRDRVMTLKHTDPLYQYAPVKITSPVQGIVSSLEVTEGTNVTKGQWLATVTDPSRLKVQIEVPAQDLAQMEAGMKGEFRASSTSNPCTVRIVGISPLVNPKTGTAPAELAFEKTPGAPVLPGTLGQVTLRANLHPALLLPEDAIVYRDGKAMVRKLDGVKMKLTVVELGDRRRGFLEIRTGIGAGDQVIIHSSRFVSDGEVVKVEDEKISEKAKS